LYLHRYIKPSNIKIDANGRLFLLDFGLAHGKAGLMHSQFSFSVPGFTPNFAPIEQIQGYQTTIQTDIYSIGATLYYLHSKQLPPNSLERAAQIAKTKKDPLKNHSSFFTSCSELRLKIIVQCLAFDQSARPKDVSSIRKMYFSKSKYSTVYPKQSFFRKKNIFSYAVIGLLFAVSMSLLYAYLAGDGTMHSRIGNTGAYIPISENHNNANTQNVQILQTTIHSNKENTLNSATNKLDTQKLFSLTPAQEDSFRSCYTVPSIVYIRAAFDSAVHGVYNTTWERDQLSGYTSFFKSRFFVLDINDAIGGIKVNILFVDKPDSVFNVWIFDFKDGDFKIHDFHVFQNYRNIEISEVKKFFSKYIYNDMYTL
jgi:serine/threonine protein kinase